jgi:Hint domain
MKRLGPIGTRRQLFRVMAAGAASVPFVALTKNSAVALPPSSARPNCLLKGTTISTHSGDRPVQELQIGDEVQTLAGRKTIKWIGYNKFTKEDGRAWPDTVMPVRVARFALGDHAPHRDLYLSPGHYVYLNEVLISVQYLINEASIAQQMPAEMSAIEYYHIDLGTHEVIHADGALVDSYFDDGSNRENFSNFVQYERLYGAEPQSRMRPFAPMLGYDNGRKELKGLMRSIISNVVDVRDPIQIAYDQIAKRAEAMLI